MVLLLAVAATFLYGTFAGWLSHWVLHQRWAGRFYRSHMNHHLKQYPPNDLVSAAYRWAGKDDSTVLFIPPVLLLLGLFGMALWKLGVPAWTFPILVAEALVVGILHDWIHLATHVDGHWMLKSAWVRHLRDLHFEHHHNMRANLGIIWFGWDRLFRTFRTWSG